MSAPAPPSRASVPEEQDPAALRPTAEHVFAARFPGHCDIGHDTIEPGDLIRGHSDNGYVHAACYDGLPDSGVLSPDLSVDRPVGAVCPRCFLEMPSCGVCKVCD